MGVEIERKFKVISNEYRSLSKGIYFHQGYLSTHKERVVRVRIIDKKAYLTIKGISTGLSRDEYEYEIPIVEAEEMLLKHCEKPSIKKFRYKVIFEDLMWEIDEFLNENEGLIIAEVELEDENQTLIMPDWIGEEVTGDPKYYNSNLISNPFKNW